MNDRITEEPLSDSVKVTIRRNADWPESATRSMDLVTDINRWMNERNGELTTALRDVCAGLRYWLSADPDFETDYRVHENHDLHTVTSALHDAERLIGVKR